MDNAIIKTLRQKAAELPMLPGVYLMRDKEGRVIYVGKAKKLKNRVSSYFRALDSHTPKVLAMVSNADDFNTIITDSEFEALVLECSLIKQYSPKYNILLKDDKGYHYLLITDEDYPRLLPVKQKEAHPPGRLLGPYTSSFVVTQTVDEVNRMFMLPTCKKKFPEDFRKGRPCLNFHIKQCMGVCTGKISKAAYAEIMEDALGFIKGHTENICDSLRQRMEKASEALDFEEAARLRDRINAIERVKERQKVFFSGVDDCDIIAFLGSAPHCAVVVMSYRGERLCDKQDFMLSTDSPLPEVRAEFLTRYYSENAEPPGTVILDGECEDEELLTEFLSGRAGRRVHLSHPQRGQKNRLVELCLENAAQLLSHTLKPTGREVSLLNEIKNLFGMQRLPQYIEAFDISNIGGSTIVGGMVVFADGKPLRRAYRKFTIKTLSGAPDDYAAMREMLTRRLTRLLEYERDNPQGEAAEGFERRPDLILIDGGKTHLMAALQVMNELGVAIPAFGMVKDSSHRTRAIVSQSGEINISPSKSVFSFITSVQDETHRFTITFSRKRHQTSSLATLIERAPGVGEKRAQALYIRFKTVKAIKAASASELSKTPGMTKGAAESLYNFLHGGAAEGTPSLDKQPLKGDNKGNDT